MPKTAPQPTTSFLDPSSIQDLLQRAKTQMQEENTVSPMLFMITTTGQPIICSLNLPKTASQRYNHFLALGRAFVRRSMWPREAALLAGGWVVRTKNREHPQRQEAITVTGRNADRTRVVSAIQPFHRSKTNTILWDELELMEQKGPLRPGSLPTGLVDLLFADTLPQETPLTPNR